MMPTGRPSLATVSFSLLEGPERRVPSKAEDDKSISNKASLKWDKKLRSSMQKSRTLLLTTSTESDISGCELGRIIMHVTLSTRRLVLCLALVQVHQFISPPCLATNKLRSLTSSPVPLGFTTRYDYRLPWVYSKNYSQSAAGSPRSGHQ